MSIHRRCIWFLSGLIILLVVSLSRAQDIYVYPNKRLADQGLIEYRRYSLDEARAYQQGGSFEPYLIASWSTERQLTQNQCPYWPQVITEGDSIFCSYFVIPGYWAYFIASYDNGVDWTEYQNMGDSAISGACMFPSIVSHNGQLLVGFKIQQAPYGEDLFYRISSDTGASWGPLRRILGYWQYDFNSFSSATNSGSTIYWVYNEGIHDSLYVIKSTNFGNSWNGRGAPIAYLSDTPQCMTARASGENVNVVWVNEILPVSVRYSCSSDAGLTWLHEIDIAQDPYGAQLCYVSVQGPHVVANWMGYKFSPYTFTGDMFIRQSFDGGITWDTAQVLTDLHYVQMGSNYIKDSLIVVTWQDERYGGNNTEVFARYSTNYGQTWSEEVRLSYGDFDSFSPIACATGNRIHILWGDNRQAARGLYYSNNDLFMGIDESDLPTEISVLSAYPNPFNSSVAIKYPHDLGNDIKIYNIAGQLVKTITCSRKEGQVTWNGTDDNGQSLSSGVYFYNLKTADFSETKKLLLIK